MLSHSNFLKKIPTVIYCDYSPQSQINSDKKKPVYTNQTASHTYSASGYYSAKLVVISNLGCSDSITHTIIVNPNPMVSFSANDTAGCDPLCISFQDLSTVSSGNNIQWQWNEGDGSAISNSQNFDHCYANSSVNSSAYYSVTLAVTSDRGCVTTMAKNNYITVYPTPLADFTVLPSKTTIVNPVISTIDASLGVDLWTWDFGDGSVSGNTSFQNPHSYADTGTYLITLITATQFGCMDTAFQTIIIEPDFLFFIPAAFSLNGDNNNDTFSGKGIFIKEYEMSIYDRWGNLIYKTNAIAHPWDGRVNNSAEIALQDVYVYSIKVTDLKNEVHLFKGTVALIK